ncbi:MAG: hypothetical protein ACLQLG_08590 [Thermoguttaceae bacterium]
MKYLLDNELAPLTFSWGFIEGPLSKVADYWVPWTKGIHGSVETEVLMATLPTALRKLEPLITPHSRELLLSTRSQWVAYFDNGKHGGDPQSRVGHVCRALKCRGVAVTCVPHTLKSRARDAKGVYGCVQFILFASETRQYLNYERSLAAANDGGRWVFHANGTPQPFEEPERYEAKRVMDRFTPEMLERYCTALGIRLFDPNFYGPDGLLISTPGFRPGHFIPLTLEQARERIGMGINPS